MTDLYWLPDHPAWNAALKDADAEANAQYAWNALVRLANTRFDFVRMQRLDRILVRRFGQEPPPELSTKPVRLAVLSSSTITQLLPAIRVAGLRRGIWVTTYEGEYNQYFRELTDQNAGLHAFRPTTILLALDAYHLLRGVDAACDSAAADSLLDEAIGHIRDCWRIAQETFSATVIQQTVLPLFAPVLGNNEHRLPGSKLRMATRLNELLREAADQSKIDLLAIDSWASAQGLNAWHDPGLWHRGKQEISPAAAPLYGDLVARIIAARQGRSFKCLVLDLDNTLWGGVIGDDGLDGIALGQGSAEGEAFLSLQQYALEQAKRGVILAVCSKNDEANALEPFDKHPDMLLKRTDIACFAANWDDKARNIRAVAQMLNIGTDSLVFVDDNPFERNLVRAELPEVAVPEVPDDPALVARCIADAGYFEGLAVTDEDRERSRQYQANAARANFQSAAADLGSYLAGLEMRLIWRRFDTLGLARIVQLINKTNQFNLTTRRHGEAEVSSVMQDPRAFGLQLRLLDRFGDNGIIAIVIGRMEASGTVVIDTWLMSCRVLGRQVEEATLNVVATEAKLLGAHSITGEYRPTAKNKMVQDHYPKLGFRNRQEMPDGATRWTLDLKSFQPANVVMAVEQD